LNAPPFTPFSAEKVTLAIGTWQPPMIGPLPEDLDQLWQVEDPNHLR